MKYLYDRIEKIYPLFDAYNKPLMERGEVKIDGIPVPVEITGPGTIVIQMCDLDLLGIKY